MPSTPLRLALAQTTSVRGDVDANMANAAAMITAAAVRGAHVVVFPELFATGYEVAWLRTSPTSWLAEEGDPRLDPIRRACADTGLTAVLGAAVRTRVGEPVIAAPVLGPEGDRGISIKQHLHASEGDLFRAGAPLPPFDVNGWKVAIAICFDVSRPEHAAKAARGGADLYVGSALYDRGEERRSDLHFGARAMDNRIFSALANHAGATGGHAPSGLSGVWGPSGEVVERAPGSEDVLLVVQLDPTHLQRYRA